MNIVVHNKLTESIYNGDDFINFVAPIRPWATTIIVDNFLITTPTTTQPPTTIERTILSASWVIIASCNLALKVVEITIMILIQLFCKTMIHRDKFNFPNVLKTNLFSVAKKIYSPLVVSVILKSNLYICNHNVYLFIWFMVITITKIVPNSLVFDSFCKEFNFPLARKPSDSLLRYNYTNNSKRAYRSPLPRLLGW